MNRQSMHFDSVYKTHHQNDGIQGTRTVALIAFFFSKLELHRLFPIGME